MMGVRENKVEVYLDSEVKRLGGLTRKWSSPGRVGVPDRIVRLPHWSQGVVWCVEVKTSDGRLSVPQSLEHKRLKDVGMNVTTIYGAVGVDAFITLIGEDNEKNK